jgi:hypothetical protein
VIIPDSFYIALALFYTYMAIRGLYLLITGKDQTLQWFDNIYVVMTFMYDFIITVLFILWILGFNLNEINKLLTCQF